MGATLSSMNDALKRTYPNGNGLEEQLFQGNEFLDRLQKRTQYKVGEAARVVLHTSRNGGTTMLPDGGGNLNTAGQQGVNKAEFNYKHMHQQIAIQEDVIEGTANDSVAVANVLDVEVSGALNDMRKQLTRQLFGNGDARITACGTTTNSATVVLSTTDGFDAIERGWLFPGLPVDIGTAGSEASLVNGETILSVSEVAATPTITVTTAITTSSSNFVSLKDARSGATSYETNGLRNIVSTSATLGGLSTTTQPVWAAANVDTTSQSLSLTLLLQQAQKVKQKTGDTPDFDLTGLKQERKFYELLQQQVRFSGDGAIGAGDVGAPTWNGRKIMAHPDCPSADWYTGIEKHLFVVASRKPFWQNAVTGGQILSWVQGTSSYGAKLGYHFNVAVDRRNCWTRLGGLA